MNKEEFEKKLKDIQLNLKQEIDEYNEQHQCVPKLDSSINSIYKKYSRQIMKLKEEYHD